MITKNACVSIVIPTFNESKVIGKLLESLNKQTYNNIETILVDDGSKDNTIKIAKKYKVKIFKRKHAERSIQRNFGAKKSIGKYLMFIDADMEFSPKVVESCVKEIESSKNIGGIVIKEESIANSFWGKVKAFERSFYNLEGDESVESARFFPRSVFEEVGGYDETITGPEDWDLPEMIKEKGYKLARVEAIIYHYERVPNPLKLARKKYYYALKASRYFKKHNTKLISSKTIYFLRPVFYRNWVRLLRHPVLSCAMVFMFILEIFGGGFGYLRGKYIQNN